MLGARTTTPIAWRVVDRNDPSRCATVTAADVRAARELGAVALGVPVARVVVTAFEEGGRV